MNWQRLDLLDQRFQANCAALASRASALAELLRHHRPALPLVLEAPDDQLRIARLDGQTAHVIPHHVPPPRAQHVLGKLCPTGKYTDPVLVAGIDQGWLWHLLHEVPPESPGRPGHKAPLFLLAHDIEELWIATHLHDWRPLLADPRVRLFVGPDAYAQLRQAILADPRLGVPRLSITLDPRVWPAGKNLDGLTADVDAALRARLTAATDKLKALYAGATDRSLAAKFRPGGPPLRVLGITARFTTFLQHSMRDWLAALESMGHQTRLLIEEADHEQLNTLVLAEESVAYRPDLILLIDHYRAELGGLPENCPAVMWVQDFLPNIQTASAGAAQKPYDYAIGYNRVECTTKFGYPASRFMGANVGVNDDRFAPLDLTPAERARFECDVCYVSHASKPAEVLLQEAVTNNVPEAGPLLRDAFERLRAVYEQGHCITHPLHVKAVIEQACAATRSEPCPDSLERLTELFVYKINNALFRHQALEWAAETGADLRIYGNGWENHPRLRQFARGPADNARDLRTIYRASRINLQAMPHGIMHQRLLEGLASGGFFLVRYVPGDVIDRVYKPLYEWCLREGVETDDDLLRRATPDVLKLLGQLQRTLGLDPFKLGIPLVDDMGHGYDLEFSRSPAFWPEYEHVSFDSRARLQERIGHFLSRPDDRESLTKSMRERVLSRLSYKAVSRRMLDFIAADLTARSRSNGAAAA